VQRERASVAREYLVGVGRPEHRAKYQVPGGT
jgi:hypothetical protein